MVSGCRVQKWPLNSDMRDLTDAHLQYFRFTAREGEELCFPPIRDADQPLRFLGF